jgi:peptidyl-prolyl cis-trans isomerase B (cyclophilin B)
MLAIGTNTFAQKKKKSMEKAVTDTLIEITTDYGTMKLKLYKETPLHRANFMKLVSEGFYDSLLFHRVIKGFMIQGGDPDSKNATPGKMLGSGDVGYKIPAELIDTLYHKKGVLAAARDGNPEKASSGCQFYIVQGKPMTEAEITQAEQRLGFTMSEKQKSDYMTVGGSPWLDRNYTVFGEIVEGLDVIDKIAAVKTLPGDRPETDVRMTVKLIMN